MTLTIRRILYSITILCFVAFAPIAILFGIGYRFSFDPLTIVKTGGMFIRTIPKDVTIQLNGNILAEKTPARIRYLWPETYTISMSKEHTHRFETTFQLPQNSVVLFDPIELFPLISQKQTALPKGTVNQSPYSDAFIILPEEEHKQPQFISLKRHESFSLPITIAKHARIEWDADDNFLVQSENVLHYVNRNKKQVFGPITSPHLAHLSLESSDTIFLMTEKGPLSLKLTTGETQKIFDREVNDLHMGKKTPLFYLAEKKQIQLGNNENDSWSIERPINFFSMTDNLLLIECEKTSYILDTNKKNVYETNLAIRKWAYDVATHTIYASTGVEIWAIDVQTQTKTFLDRYSSAISHIGISPNHSAIFVTFSDNMIVRYISDIHTTISVENIVQPLGYASFAKNEYYILSQQEDKTLLNQYVLK